MSAREKRNTLRILIVAFSIFDLQFFGLVEFPWIVIYAAVTVMVISFIVGGLFLLDLMTR